MICFGDHHGIFVVKVLHLIFLINNGQNCYNPIDILWFHFLHSSSFINVVSIWNLINYVYQSYYSIWHFCFIYFCFTYMAYLKKFYRHMSIYNFLLLHHHNLDSIMFIIQFPIVQKFNKNIMTMNLPFNLKQTYQFSFICPFSLLLSITCLEHNVIWICRSKDIPNLIILLSLDLVSSEISNHFFLSPYFATLPIWNSDLL
jgi:hypothetical protein